MKKTSRQDGEKNTFEKIYDVVKMIPEGSVASYGQVAEIAGNPRWSRVVGYALHSNPDPEHIPCHRVVTKDGRVSDAFAFGGGNEQVRRLKEEGVEFDATGRVVMEKFQMRF
ncbi:MAG: MGMT family protein [Lachnospira sp.]|nr:MGMT family protein [Lachnospira sp.]